MPNLSIQVNSVVNRGILQEQEIVVSRAEVEEYIRKEAIEKNVPPSWAVQIAQCESGLNPKAINEKDTDGLPAFGLWQFKEETFKKWEGIDIWDWKEQTGIAIKMLSEGYWKSWPTCSIRFSSEA